MRPDAAMIFCAGFGTRMGELTADLPKPLLHVGGLTLFDRMLGLARNAAISRIVINTHYKADLMGSHVAGTDVAISREDPHILDTGGGLKAAAAELGDAPVFTANPDVIWVGPNPFDVAANQWSDALDALLVCVPVERALGRDCGDFGETASGGLSRNGPLVYGGLQIIRTGVVTAVPDESFSLNVVWDDLIAKNRVRAAIYPGSWCDVGTPEGLARAEELVAGHGGV